MLNNIYFRNAADVACNAILSAGFTYGASAFLRLPLNRVQAVKLGAIAAIAKDVFEKSTDTCQRKSLPYPRLSLLQFKVHASCSFLSLAGASLTASRPYLSAFFNLAAIGAAGFACRLIVRP